MADLAHDHEAMTSEQRNITQQRNARTERDAFGAAPPGFLLRGLHKGIRDTTPPESGRDREPADIKRIAVDRAKDAGDQLAAGLDDEARFVLQPRGKIGLGFR